MVKHIDISTKSFDECINKHGNTQQEKLISVNEFKDTFFILKMNKSADYDETIFNVVKKYFGVLHKPQLHIFIISLKTPDKLKISRITPLFKGSKNYELGNDRPIYVLPCCICVDCFHKHLNYNDILYKKQFGFQEVHFTEHVKVQLVDQIRSSFVSNQYTLTVFVEISKVFDTANHKN